jgi:hypothetical protein
MALKGLLREGAGGSGVAVLDLDEFHGEIVYVNTSMFGCGVTTGGQAIAACTPDSIRITVASI